MNEISNRFQQALDFVEVSVVKSGGAVVIADASFLENMIKDAVNKAIANG